MGEQQRAEILKALYRRAEILILDEPTGVLTPQEADQLFTVLDALRSQGVTIILITHKLREIMDITDTVSVLRLGEMVAHRATISMIEAVQNTHERRLARSILPHDAKDCATRYLKINIAVGLDSTEAFGDAPQLYCIR